MKLKKLIGIFVLIIFFVLMFAQNGYATNTTKEVKINSVRSNNSNNSSATYNYAGPFSYKVNSSDTRANIVWNLQETGAKSAIYCLNQGVGFGPHPEINDKIYDTSYNFRDLESIPSKYRTPWATDTKTYNSILWIIDNMFISQHANATEREEMRVKLIEAAFAGYLKGEEGVRYIGGAPSINDIHLTYDDIEVAQQLAIWYFTNKLPYELPAIWVSEAEARSGKTNIMSSIQWKALSDVKKNDTDEGWWRDDDIRTLYKYFVTQANKNSSSYSRGTVTINKELEPKIVESTLGTNYIMGPFELKKLGGNEGYTITHKITDQSGTEITSYSITDANGNSIPGLRTIEDAAGKGEFYVSIPKTALISTVEQKLINIKIDVDNGEITKATFWTIGSSTEEEQPLVVVEKERNTDTYSAPVQIPEKVFDLSLRKYIVAVNDIPVDNSRVPNINTTNLASGTATTAEYKHRKDPIMVETGDIVTYKITIYNEGELDGRPIKIVDQLPQGVVFDKLVTTGYAVNALSDNKIEITNNATTNIPAYTKTGEPSSITIELKCKVTQEKTNVEQILTNVAWISEQVCIYEKDDRDSLPSRVPPITSLPDYIGNPENKTDLTDSSYYYKGYEDDDDFEKLILPAEKPKKFDLALKKFVTKVQDTTISNRAPIVSVDSNGLISYNTDEKEIPVSVENADLVEYTIRVYNEGEVAGYAQLVKDDIPDGLQFVLDNETNIEYRWKLSDDEKYLSTDYLSKERNNTNLLEPFAFPGVTEPAYKDVKIVFKVSEPNGSTRIIINTAEIQEDCDQDGNEIDDIDSIPNNNIQSEDDIDTEKIRLKYFDLALRKFITKLNTTTISTREPLVVLNQTTGAISYEHTKEPVNVVNGNLVEYTIRVFNEGTTEGYATEVKDDVPQGLEFVADDETNVKYGWQLSEDGKIVSTKYLSKEKSDSNLIKGFDRTTMSGPNYQDVKVVFKVIEPNTSTRILINTAEIKDDSDRNGNLVLDIDSTPDNGIESEDDIDKEYLKIATFDLSLKKFITKVNDEIINDRYPIFKINTDESFTYEVKKTPVEVANNDVVEYTIRVYNEGNLDGYAEEVIDDVPEGLEFLPDSETNIRYGWKLSEDGKKVVTNYLSKDTDVNNKLAAFIIVNMGEPAYKDIKVAFKVVEPNTMSDRIIKNTAEISKDYNDADVKDVDSTPNNNVDGEDDQDNEYIKVKYFDLSLLKYVVAVNVIQDGTSNLTQTGYNGTENPEPIVKVEVDRKKLSSTVVKFIYNIKITNEGEIGGYAREIADYVPQGLQFLQEDNQDWKIEAGNKITTRALENKYLNPGESADAQIILTWDKNTNDLGAKTNIAEIKEDYNDSHSKDIDSTPDNQIEGEDDQDKAIVIITLTTGGAPMYITITAATLLILAGGIYLVKKYII